LYEVLRKLAAKIIVQGEMVVRSGVAGGCIIRRRSARSLAAPPFSLPPLFLIPVTELYGHRRPPLDLYGELSAGTDESTTQYYLAIFPYVLLSSFSYLII